MQTDEQQIKMYGCTVADMRATVEESLDLRFGGGAMVAMSMLSDAQEEVARGMQEHARQTINRAKWVIHNYCRHEWKPGDTEVRDGKSR